MAEAVKQKKESTVLSDMEVMWYLVRDKQDLTKSGLRSECAYIKADEKDRFDRAFNEALKRGFIIETDEKIKVGLFKREHVLKLGEHPKMASEEPSIKKDIDALKKGK
jgi:hypothetical protein